jgi:[acyl-carrier-protein] S-malonyltransferase
MSIALVFPGQGSQSLGMLAALSGHYAQAAQCLEQGSQVLGYDLARLITQGPAERLNSTEYTQPAMLAAGVATWRAWREQGGAAPAAVAGHSLGEFTALVCAEALPFEAALRLVQYRGQIMQRAVPEGAGAMAAILGLDDAEVEAACGEAAQGEVVEAVNYNSPGQVVIAGHAGAVERAIELAKQRGAKRAVLLPVSVMLPAVPEAAL